MGGCVWGVGGGVSLSYLKQNKDPAMSCIRLVPVCFWGLTNIFLALQGPPASALCTLRLEACTTTSWFSNTFTSYLLVSYGRRFQLSPTVELAGITGTLL